MRFIWFSAALAAVCVGAPTGLKHTTRTTLNPNGDVVRSPPVSGQDLELTAQAVCDSIRRVAGSDLLTWADLPI
ncbi:unnamed protein product [Penicillium salamii]|nr:unnamed protein product [Penicillium salamii]